MCIISCAWENYRHFEFGNKNAIFFNFNKVLLDYHLATIADRLDKDVSETFRRNRERKPELTEATRDPFAAEAASPTAEIRETVPGHDLRRKGVRIAGTWPLLLRRAETGAVEEAVGVRVARVVRGGRLVHWRVREPQQLAGIASAGWSRSPTWWTEVSALRAARLLRPPIPDSRSWFESTSEDSNWILG